MNANLTTSFTNLTTADKKQYVNFVLHYKRNKNEYD